MGGVFGGSCGPQPTIHQRLWRKHLFAPDRVVGQARNDSLAPEYMRWHPEDTQDSWTEVKIRLWGVRGT